MVYPVKWRSFCYGECRFLLLEYSFHKHDTVPCTGALQSYDDQTKMQVAASQLLARPPRFR